MPNDSGQAALLDRSRFCVTRAEDPRDVYLMRNVFPFSVAVLSDTIGGPALQASAEMVRGHWPKARIFILGEAPQDFEDHLYDETIGHAASGSALLEMLDKVSDDLWSERTDALALWLDRICAAPRLQQSHIHQESTPAEVSEAI